MSLRNRFRRPATSSSNHLCQPRVEVLEERCLLAADFGPLGEEFQVNTYTTGEQRNASVAVDSVGNFIVAWQSYGQDGSQWGIYAQRYDSNGVPLGNEFRVNSYTTGTQSFPSIAMDALGNFVVAWQSNGQDGSDYGIYAQRYNNAGEAQGGEFLVNTYTTSFQRDPSVAMDSSGDFVIVWRSFGQDGSGWGIFGQRYSADGSPQGSEFLINTYTTGLQSQPAVAMDGAGNFVVVWESYFQDGFLHGIFAQRFSASGVPQGPEFQVNSTATGNQIHASVAMDSSGSFVVVWESSFGDGSLNGIFAQRYNSSGVPQGGEFQVNTFTTSEQRSPTVAMDSGGNFVVAWQSFGQDESNYGIFAQRYLASGAAEGSEFQVNTYTTGNQQSPSVAMDPAGNFVVVWESNGQDGSSSGIFAQRYGESTPPPVAPTVTDVQVRGTAWNASLPWYSVMVGSADQLIGLPWTNLDQIRIVFSGSVIIESDDLEILGVNVADYSGLVTNFTYDPTTFTATWTLSSAFAADKILLRLADGVIQGTNGLDLDGEWVNGSSSFPSGDGTPGGTFAFRFNTLPGNANLIGTQVNALDWSFVRSRLFQNFGDPDYTIYADVNGNGTINAIDWSSTRARLFTSLPAGDPAAALAAFGDPGGASPSPMMQSIFLSASTELFTQSTIEVDAAGPEESAFLILGRTTPQPDSPFPLAATAVDRILTEESVNSVLPREVKESARVRDRHWARSRPQALDALFLMDEVA